jgi:glyoxylase-like metal-dependent hydrolase (beta-lactamase superfamily II)
MEERRFGPLWFIPGENNGKYPFCHSIYIEGAGILIDPASNRKRLAQMRENNDIEAVWLSHWHEDHLMYLDLFDGLPLSISERDAPPISDVELFLDAYGMYDEDEREQWRVLLRENFHFRPRRPYAFLRDGEVIRLGDTTVEVISTPGHTPGHISLWFQDLGIVFLGDYDLTKFGPWYGDVESSIEETIRSVNRLRQIQAKVWLTAHETGVFEESPGYLWDQYLGVIAEREGKLLNLLEKPRTLEEIVGAWIVYGRPRKPKAFFEFGERALMKKHLERLISQGIVKKNGNRFVVTL